MSGVSGSTPVNISVILPTLNRADSLREALERLKAQETGGRFTYEMIVVDNGSTDHTRRVVEALQPAFPVPLRYVYEAQRGRPCAVNAGMAMAGGGLFVFTDDDILTPPGWLAAMWTCFQEEHPDGIAGRVVPLWLASPPEWLGEGEMRKLGQIGCVDHGLERRSSRDGRYCRWVGGNLAISRAAVERIGPYDVCMTRTEDTEYFWRFMDRGLVVCYEPAAVVQHKVGAERMNPEYFRRWRHREGYYLAHLIPWKPFHLVTIMPLWRARVTLNVLAAWIRSVVTRQPWLTRFKAELLVRQEVSVWARRLQLWPQWWGAMFTGRRSMCEAGVAHGEAMRQEHIA